MALTKASMAAKIKTALAAVGDPATYGTPQAYADACREAMCEGIIEELTTNGVLVVASAAVLTGGAPGTGTIT